MLKRIWRHLHNLEPWQRILYVIFIAQLMAALGFSNIFPFLPLYVAELGSYTGLSVEFLAGMVFSSQAITMMIASPIWGALADRYGRKLMVQRAMFGGAVLLLLMGFVRSAEELILLRALQGMVTGTVSAANALVAAAAPRQRAGYAMGVVQVGLWSGLAIGPVVGGFTADAFGYRETFVITSVALAAAGLLVHFGVEEVTAVAAQSERQKVSLWRGWQHVFQAEGVPLTFLLRFLANLGRMVVVPIAPLFVQVLIADPARVNTATGIMVGLANAAVTATAVYMGRLGDRIGHRRVLMLSALGAGLLYLPQSLVTEAWQLMLLQALTGAASGGIIPSLSALLAQYTEAGEEGSVFGLDNSVVAGSRAVAPLAGSGVALWLGLRATFVFTGFIFLLVVLLALWRLPESRPYQPQAAGGD